MSISWPPELPQAFDADGLTITSPDNVIRRNMDVGPSTKRLRDTSAPYKITGKITMTQAQYLIFEEFFEETCAYGALSFTWIHPNTLVSVTMDFSSAPKVEDNEGLAAVTLAMEMRK